MNKAAKDAPDASASGIPAKRIGTAEDMAAAAIYLCSRAGDYVAGETLTVDGGVVNAHLPSHFAIRRQGLNLFTCRPAAARSERLAHAQVDARRSVVGIVAILGQWHGDFEIEVETRG